MEKHELIELYPELNKEQIGVLYDSMRYKNIFLTGKAGSGKSYVIQKIKELKQELKKNIVILAPTAIVAKNLGGYTYHSYFQIAKLDQCHKKIIKKLAANSFYKYKIRSLDCIIFDEVSMMSSIPLKYIDAILRDVCKDNRPFGGIQCIFVGDFYQLPYIKKQYTDYELKQYINVGHPSGFKEELIFTTSIWTDLDITYHNLIESKRHKDTTYMQLLDRVRTYSITDEDRKLFISKIEEYNKLDYSIIQNYTHLMYTKEDVNKHNSFMFNLLSTEIFTYKSYCIEDNRPYQEKEYNLLNIAEYEQNILQTLNLRVGCKALINYNINKDLGLVNGTQVTIVDFQVGYPVIEYELNGEKVRHLLEPYEFTEYLINEFDSNGNKKIKWVIKQIPLILAYAITIHKSQGLTLDNVVVDLKLATSFGSAYTALSRCKSLEGLCIKSLPYNFGKVSNDSDYININILYDHIKEVCQS